VLFEWDGDALPLVSDHCPRLGGLGYLVAPGEYAPTRPWENVLLPGGRADAAQRAYATQAHPSRWGALYLDEAAHGRSKT